MCDISVIIPIYNTEEYLQECLDSVWNNIQHLSAEVHLVDDGSTDDSYEIARAFEQQHDNVHLYRLEHAGVSVARNIAIEHAQGEYLAFVDSDDIVAPNSFKRLLGVARLTKAEITMCDAARLRPDGKTPGSSLHTFAFTTLPDNITNLQESPSILVDACLWDKLINRKFYLESNVTFPEGYSVQDYPVLTELYLRSERIAIVRELGYYWRVRGNEQNLSTSQRHLERKNLTNRIAMDTLVFSLLDRYRADENVRLVAEYKLLAMDFNGYFQKLHMLSQEGAQDYINLMADAVELLVRPSALGYMPLRVRQRTEYLLQRNVSALIRFEGYCAESYKKALVRDIKGHLIADVPSDLFSETSPCFEQDVMFSNPLSRIERIYSPEDNSQIITLEGTLYTPRVSIPSIGDQELSAYLINDLTGTKLPVMCRACAAPDLTTSKGTVIDHKTYVPHTYCYDGAGFVIQIDVSAVDQADGLMGKNALVLEYSNKYKTGRRTLRGSSPQARKDAKAFSYQGTYAYRLMWDRRGTFFVEQSSLPQDDTQRKPTPKAPPL